MNGEYAHILCYAANIYTYHDIHLYTHISYCDVICTCIRLYIYMHTHQTLQSYTHTSDYVYNHFTISTFTHFLSPISVTNLLYNFWWHMDPLRRHPFFDATREKSLRMTWILFCDTWIRYNDPSFLMPLESQSAKIQKLFKKKMLRI